MLRLDEERILFEPQWSPDGAWLVARTAGAQGGSGDILALRPDQDTAAVPLVATGFTEFHPTLSPDGRWMAYQSNETGSAEIYVVPFPSASAAKWPVSTGGGTEPLWSRTGQEIFYRMSRPVGAEAQTEMILVQNFFEELKRLVPNQRNDTARQRLWNIAGPS